MTPPRIFLHEWRKARGLTQEQLGELVGTTGATISRWEKSEHGHGLDLNDLLRLVRVLKITPNEMFLPPDLTDFWALRDIAEKR